MLKKYFAIIIQNDTLKIAFVILVLINWNSNNIIKKKERFE